MGKGGGRSSGRAGASTPSRPSAQRPSQQQQTRAVQPAPQAQQAKPAQQPNPQPQAVPQASSGPGIMSTIGSVAAGSIIGHVVADKLLGGGSSEAQPQLEQAPMQQPCAQFKMNFDTCLFNNANQIYACQTNWEQYRACMQNNNQNWS